MPTQFTIVCFINVIAKKNYLRKQRERGKRFIFGMEFFLEVNACLDL